MTSIPLIVPAEHLDLSRNSINLPILEVEGVSVEEIHIDESEVPKGQYHLTNGEITIDSSIELSTLSTVRVYIASDPKSNSELRGINLEKWVPIIVAIVSTAGLIFTTIWKDPIVIFGASSDNIRYVDINDWNVLKGTTKFTFNLRALSKKEVVEIVHPKDVDGGEFWFGLRNHVTTISRNQGNIKFLAGPIRYSRSEKFSLDIPRIVWNNYERGCQGIELIAFLRHVRTRTIAVSLTPSWTDLSSISDQGSFFRAILTPDNPSDCN